jgi:hypothetical protein
MEARLLRAALLAAALVSCLGAGYRTTNFVVEAPTAELAEKIGKSAELYRRELAIDWLGDALPNWPQPCPIHAQVAPHLGAGGATSFMFDRGEVFGWQMNIQGTEERIIDSVLPHEVTHTIFASHFRRPLPRWADEGACTTVEHPSERGKQERMLIDFLRTNRGIAFSQMFVMTEYPQDILPLYAQGYALARFLIDQKGKHEFLAYLQEGMSSDDWTTATERHYGYKNLGVLQNTWLDWVKRGSPLENPAPGALEMIAAQKKSRANSGVVLRAQASDQTTTQLVAVRNTETPLRLADAKATPISRPRDRSDNAPIRNGSVVIDRGEPIAGKPPAALPKTPPAAPPTAVAMTTAAAPTQAPPAPTADLAWRSTDQSAANSSEPPAPPTGRSVYGNGVGLIHHSSEAQSYSAERPQDRSESAPPSAQPSAEQNPRHHVLLEWDRQQP